MDKYSANCMAVRLSGFLVYLHCTFSPVRHNGSHAPILLWELSQSRDCLGVLYSSYNAMQCYFCTSTSTVPHTVQSTIILLLHCLFRALRSEDSHHHIRPVGFVESPLSWRALGNVIFVLVLHCTEPNPIQQKKKKKTQGKRRTAFIRYCTVHANSESPLSQAIYSVPSSIIILPQALACINSTKAHAFHIQSTAVGL